MILAALPLAAQAAPINTSRSNIKRPSIVASPSPTQGASPALASGQPLPNAASDAPKKKHSYKGIVTLVR
jgi:hypothetical protein